MDSVDIDPDGCGTSDIAPAGYRPRLVDERMSAALRAMPAVVVEGPRACGKTWTGRRFAASAVYLDERASASLTAGMDPASILDGATPRLLDEWQLAPAVWNAMRRACDARGQRGQFILTGSADPPDDITRHSGAGRIMRVPMRTMSLFESGESSGDVSFQGLIDGEACTAADGGLSLGDVLALACRGGWPQQLDADLPTAADAATAYLDEISRTDVSRVDGVERDPIRVRRLLVSIARNVATEVRHTVLAADTAAAGEPPLERRTVAGYLAALGRLFVVEEIPAWRPHIASRAQVRNAAKIHFVDPSLTAAALRTTVGTLMSDLSFAGRLFESMALRDLQVYAEANRCSLSHYRDSHQLEVDAIIEHADGRWAAAEIKLGVPDAIDKGAESLLRLRAKLKGGRTGPPARLAVITAIGYAYERPDGVCVVPLTSMRP
ncbi:ATP-binding protein [Candidatus Poriferisocius sp.]|uniref:ATP-binding protein n=1 Tax=Candidatus Poriferisocius sp. TaxID=3101276 RepID=UPI003B022A04